LAHAFEKHIDRSFDDVMSIEGLFAGSERISRDEFRRFAGRILERNLTLQALSWNPRVLHRDRPAYEAEGRAEGFAGYQFTERAAEGLRPAAERPDYVVVHYIEPYAGNEPALGYDIASNSSRLVAIERARDTGRPAVTPGIRLVQETGAQTGVLILMPVYAGGVRPETLEERRRELVGYATGVLRLEDALRSALAGLPSEGFAVTLVDRSVAPGEGFLAALPGELLREGSARLEWSFDWEIGGRSWSLGLAPTPGLLAGYGRWYAWLVLAGGLALVSLLGALLLVQSGRAAELAVLNARLEQGIERRRLLEAQRERLIGELEQRNAELERFSFTVSHDLKSPLTTIKGFLALLETDLPATRPAEVDAEIAQLHQAADYMRDLVDDLLALSRAGQATGPAETLALDAVAREAVAQVAGGENAARVRIDVAPDLPRVSANRRRLLEVLQNLLDNAIKFSNEGDDPRVEIGATADGDRVVCHVRDNGIGIDPAHHERVFELFTRLDPTRDGTGIGLALVSRIIETSGGSVWVESEGAGHGSTFYFTLPTAPSA
jgi:signal transduction histidine kinase